MAYPSFLEIGDSHIARIRRLHIAPSPRFSYSSVLDLPADNPWEDYANAAEGPDGTILSGWEMRHSRLPARVKEEHSETAYMTDRAIEFIRTQGDAPWFLHLSFIKPHWPYIAPAPYNDMYQEAEVVPPLRDSRERESPNPVYAAFMLHEESINFSRDEVRHTVIPTYMGLVKQIDDHLGRLLDVLKEAGRIGDTMIVFTSDHGDLPRQARPKAVPYRPSWCRGHALDVMELRMVTEIEVAAIAAERRCEPGYRSDPPQ